MKFDLKRLWIPLGLAALLIWAWQVQGWLGVAMVGSGAVLWALLHVTRLMTVVRRAADRPIGWVDSAVMLNAKLRKGQSLLHVMALTRSMGERLTPEGAEPETYRWSDNGQSHVTITLSRGRVQQWELTRPAP